MNFFAVVVVYNKGIWSSGWAALLNIGCNLNTAALKGGSTKHKIFNCILFHKLLRLKENDSENIYNK